MTLPAAPPPVIPEPFAQNAGPDFIQNPIPETTGSAGRASYDQGWPAQTMQPVVAGGVPPWGQDFNGLMFAVTAQLYFLQSGQRWPFNADVATAIGGYPFGAIVAMADGTGEWISTGDANSGNPDTGAPFWAPISSYGNAVIPVTAGAVTVANSDAKKPFIVFTGTLSGNVAVTLPAYAKEWLLVNATTGAFNLTANAGGGLSVNVPQGGFGSPLGVYGIGDGNLYPSVSPLGVPISVASVPNTLVERDANAYIYVGTANVSNGVVNAGIINVFIDQGDGFLTKNSLANFESQLLLSALSGQVTAAQVPVGAVTQYSPQILASAILTGTPSVPTQAPGTSNTTPASTAFVNPGSSLNPNGYRKNADGSIDQWGTFNTTANAGVITGAFNIPFPTACYQFDFTVIAPGGTGGAGSRESDCSAAPTTNNFFIRQAASSNTNITIQWRAIGK